jgi:hypothetical protein
MTQVSRQWRTGAYRVGVAAGRLSRVPEPAERLDRARDGVLAEPLIADVARGDDAAAPLLLDQHAGRRGVLVLVEIDDRDVGALFRAADRDRAADAAVAAGDQRGLALSLPAARYSRISERGLGTMSERRPG